MNLDPTLAFTAVIELRPANTDPTLKTRLAEAMTAANPANRWKFARAWLDGNAPA